MNLFKQLYCQINNFDVKAVEREDKEKEEKKNKDKIILSKKNKIYLSIILAIFEVITIVAIGYSFMATDIFGIIRNIILIIINTTNLCCVNIKKKKWELTALAGLMLEIIITFFIPYH